MFTLVTNGTLYAPEPLGRLPLLIAGDRVAKIGGVGEGALRGLGVDFDVIDADGCVVTPGLIDPHDIL